MAITTPITSESTPRQRTPGAPWPIPDAAEFLSVSARHLQRLMDSRKVQSISFGRRRLIADGEVQRLAREGC